LTARLFDNWLIALTACLIAGTLSGIIYFLIFEKPALKRLKPTRAAGLEAQA
jgi:peptidoglycan/LPS O-acetylase OafA/YrhL